MELRWDVPDSECMKQWAKRKNFVRFHECFKKFCRLKTVSNMCFFSKLFSLIHLIKHLKAHFSKHSTFITKSDAEGGYCVSDEFFNGLDLVLLKNAFFKNSFLKKLKIKNVICDSELWNDGSHSTQRIRIFSSNCRVTCGKFNNFLEPLFIVSVQSISILRTAVRNKHH